MFYVATGLLKVTKSCKSRSRMVYQVFVFFVFLKKSAFIHLKGLSNPLFFFVAEPTDNASVSFVKYKGDYYVSTETNFMHKVNPENLETLEKVLT